MKLPVILQHKIVEFLQSLPNIDDISKRQAFIYSLGLDTELQAQLSFQDPPAQFVPLLVKIMLQYGKLHDGRYALETLLEATKNFIGEDRRTQECEPLIQELQELRIKERNNTSRIDARQQGDPKFLFVSMRRKWNIQFAITILGLIIGIAFISNFNVKQWVQKYFLSQSVKPTLISTPILSPTSQPSPVLSLSKPTITPMPAQMAVSAQKEYVGNPFSAQFNDADLLDFLDVIAEVSGLNIVVRPGVYGRVTERFDNIPWNQAIDIVAEHNNISMEIEGNVLLVMSKQFSASRPPKKEYSGKPMTVTFQQTDLVDVLDAIARVAGMNIGIAQGVTGRVTLHLKDVPWDQLLDIICEMNNLTKEEKMRNFIYIEYIGRDESKNGKK